MDAIAAVSNQMNAVSSAMSMGVLKKAMDQQGQAALQLIQSMPLPQVNPNVGSNFDQRA